MSGPTTQDHRSRRRSSRRTPVVPQAGDTDCGPAALTSLLWWTGRPVAMAEVTTRCGTGRDGSHLADLVRVASGYGVRAQGVRASFTGTPGDADVLHALPGPAVVVLTGHHVVVLEEVRRTRRGGYRVHLNDPATGRRRMPLGQFVGACGPVMVVVPDTERAAGRIRRLPDPTPLRQWWRDEPRSSSALVAVAVLLGAVAVLTSLLVTAIVRGAADPTGPAGHGPALAALAAVALAAHWGQRRARSALLHRSSSRRGEEFVSALLTLPADWFRNRFTGEVATRSQRIDGAALQVATMLVSGGTQIITAVAALVALTLLAPAAAPLVLAGLAVDLLLHLAGRAAEQASADRATAARSACDGEIISALVGIETVKAEAGGGLLHARWTAARHRSVLEEDRSATRSRLLRRAGTAVDQTVVLLLLVLIGTGTVTVGPGGLLAVVVLAAMAQTAGGGLLRQGLFDVAALRACLRGVREVHDARTALPADRPADGEPDPAAMTPSSAPPAEVWTSAVTLTGVAVGYHPFRPPVLADVDLLVPAGRITFLTGRTGSGKSSLAKAVAGTLTVQRGSIVVSGSGSGSGTAYVPQRPVLLEGTLAENVLFGGPVELTGRLADALAAAGLTDVVARRGGPGCPVAQDGANFSGGERQRIALARALVRRPALLVLDEATSAMEEPLEEALFAGLRDRGLTVLAVAHRLPTLHPQDQVAHLAAGTLRVLRPAAAPESGAGALSPSLSAPRVVPLPLAEVVR
ncbi:ATP-binding cassette domain-containing protein [Nakamurella flavida]|uniref:ATP-binding cassette domain-containing protein n=1 Tax=Nakamurella flavida TaxID=363630 RepID=UPI0031E3EFE2